MSGSRELAYLSLAVVSSLIAARRLSPVEYARALLDRIDGLESRLHAFVTLEPESALREARRAEMAIARDGPRSPLHGIGVGLKDIIDAKGWPTTCQSKILAGSVAVRDATVTARLKAAGAFILGKLTTHEFAVGGPSFDLPWPPARNPWNLDAMPGGSSSGAGAALAAGLLPAALGSDTAGSVRNPASMCGVVGMKPTFGLVSRRGVFPLSETLDHVGPMTRTVEDNAILLRAIAGFDVGDPGSVEAPRSDPATQLNDGVEGLTIGIVRHFHQRDQIADPDMARAIEDAIGVLAGLGAQVREIELRPLADYTACNRAILSFESYRIHEQWLADRPGDYGALTRERIGNGADFSAEDYSAALAERNTLVADYDARTAGLDAVICASGMAPAFGIDDTAAIAHNYMRHARTPFNVTGHPALALPIGFSDDGLPLSMQIAGARFGEATIYRVAQAYEKATGWTAQHPAIESLEPA